jgi:hypothetical protein
VAYDLGAAVPLAVTVTDAAGTAADATTIVLTVGLPDGTAVTPAVTNPPATTGQYSYVYTPAQAGRHTVGWVTTAPAFAHTDVFYVRAASTPALVSLADVKAHLNIPASTTTHDAELRDAILTAGDVVEGIVGAVGRRTVTETHSGRGRPGLVLRDGPAISITSVTEDGTAVASGGYTLDDDTGILYRVSGYSDLAWPVGRRNVVVTYVVGRSAVPPAISEAVKDLVRINFRPQLGGNYSPFDTSAAGAGSTRLGYFVPDKIMTSLARYDNRIGFA